MLHTAFITILKSTKTNTYTANTFRRLLTKSPTELPNATKSEKEILSKICNLDRTADSNDSTQISTLADKISKLTEKKKPRIKTPKLELLPPTNLHINV